MLKELMRGPMELLVVQHFACKKGNPNYRTRGQRDILVVVKQPGDSITNLRKAISTVMPSAEFNRLTGIKLKQKSGRVQGPHPINRVTFNALLNHSGTYAHEWV
ncbi:hypothetical protein HY994_01780 [Candidatus Micrarchaeota archaeon]|nr:hypothetical protein [Candidatus Micrarchaeota archaeon]